MYISQLSTYILLSVLIFISFASSTKHQDSILLRDIEILTFRNGEWTTYRRTEPLPQLLCVKNLHNDNDDICFHESDKVISIQCKNVGFDGEDVNWLCESILNDNIKLGNVDVICEGYDDPEDPYILKGSCGVEYELEYINTSNLYSIPVETVIETTIIKEIEIHKKVEVKIIKETEIPKKVEVKIIKETEIFNTEILLIICICISIFLFIKYIYFNNIEEESVHTYDTQTLNNPKKLKYSNTSYTKSSDNIRYRKNNNTRETLDYVTQTNQIPVTQINQIPVTQINQIPITQINQIPIKHTTIITNPIPITQTTITKKVIHVKNTSNDNSKYVSKSYGKTKRR